MASGLSFDSFGASIGVAKDRVYEWAHKHPEFADAKKLSLELNLLWWERQSQQGLWTEKDGPNFNTTLWIFNMKNRHGWRDRQDIDMKTTAIDAEREKIRAMPTQELLEIVKTMPIEDAK